ncbi:MAG: hypothetical protein J0L58_10245 [Burkholderiales bacterium]|uniref:hypothetical protein n=1 Tax=Inhella sp. TaxID=1921806 RepID=UPI001AC764E8|nr:hypothetical protein [Burkholderiales bacterium]
MNAHAAPFGLATPTQASIRISPLRRALARGLQTASRWLDQRAYALEYPEERISVPVGPSQIEVVRDPHTGFAVVYMNGERQFTFVRGLDRL